MPKNKPGFLFFDVEAGGFSGHQSSILSIAHGNDPSNVKALHAAPDPGTQLSVWSQNKVWVPMQKQAKAGKAHLQTEKEILSQFLNVLEEQESGTVLTGWNIGYKRAAQEAEGSARTAQGFDIPMIMTRAKKYGMEKQFREQFSRFKIRDIGAEYAYQMSKEALGYEKYIQKDLFAQLKSYAEAGMQYQARRGASQAETAEHLAGLEFKLQGWRQEQLYEAVFGTGFEAHKVEEDVKAGIELFERSDQKIFQNEGTVKKWASDSYRNRLVSSLKYPGLPEDLAEAGITQEGRFAHALRGAQAWEAGDVSRKGFTEGFLGSLKSEVSAAGGTMESVRAGRGFIGAKPIIAGEFQFAKAVRGARASAFLDDMLGLARRNKVGVGIAAGAAALYALQPGNWFSGKDDAYNTIEGLPHGGEAERLRRLMTDFGSGYKGDRDITLWRGTPQFVGTHTPQRAGKSELTQVEKLYEQVRQQHYSHFPKRSDVTYWSTDRQWSSIFAYKEVLVDYNEYVNTGQEYYASIRRREQDVQLFSDKIYSKVDRALQSGKQEEAQRLTHRYWQGLDPSGKKLTLKSPGTEALLQGATQAEKVYELDPYTGKLRIDWTAKHGDWAMHRYELYVQEEEKLAAQVAKQVKSVTGVKPGLVNKSFGVFKQLTGGKKGIAAMVAAGTAITGLFTYGLYSLFSGKDDAHNTIEGLPHGGMAELSRKKHSDFGSGWDALRGIVRATETFAGMTKSKAFQAALKSAKPGKVLGKGAYGEVRQMTGKFRGEEFSFARKTGSLENLTMSEVGIMEKLQADKFRSSPSFYGSRVVGKQRQVDIELFQGETLRSLSRAERSPLKEEARDLLQELHKSGVFHGDFHTGNIMRVKTDKGFELGALDFGHAKELTGNLARSQDMSFFTRNFNRGMISSKGVDDAFGELMASGPVGSKGQIEQVTKHVDPFASGPVSSSGINKQAWHNKHKESQVRSSVNAVNPGSRHRKQTGKLVQ